MIFCITGMPGAGKSIISETAKSLGFKIVNMGDVIREEAAVRGITKTPTTLGALMLKLRKEEGNNVVAKRCLAKIKNEPLSIIEGVRSMDELTYFKKNDKVCLIAVHASPVTRFERLLKRGRPDDPKDINTFKERDLRELNVGLGSVIALADKVFVNEGTVEDLQRTVKKFFEGIRRGDKGLG
jgi:dephospho-CoA kinase